MSFERDANGFSLSWACHYLADIFKCKIFTKNTQSSPIYPNVFIMSEKWDTVLRAELGRILAWKCYGKCNCVIFWEAGRQFWVQTPFYWPGTRWQQAGLEAEGRSEPGQNTSQEKRLLTQRVGERVEKEMPPVKRCAWGKDFLADGAGARGNKLAAGAENYPP